MEKVTIAITPGPAPGILLLEFPELAAESRWVRKGIDLLRQYAPGVLGYLSRQRILAHLDGYPIEVRGAGAMTAADVRAVLARWMQGKRNRRLLYIVLELLLMPFTAFVALLPGPNIVFYGLFVLFYFHFKAFLSLSRIKAEELDITLVRD